MSISWSSSPFGVITEKNQPDKWRLILDLSSPAAHSVNDGIPRAPYSLHHISVDTTISAILELGPGAQMAKFDVETAYRNIPIHPADQCLLGMYWRDGYFVDLSPPPFGLRSAPFIFYSVADLVEWNLKHNYGLRCLYHYLDDYLTLGPAHSQECARNVVIANKLSSRLGLPLHPSKCVGPATVLVFFGINLDGVALLARLPSEKFASTLQILHDWERRRWCRQKLESLIGTLHHFCQIIPPDRAFLRRMINLLCCFRNPAHPIRLNTEFHQDLSWWLEFFPSWAEVSFFRMPNMMPLPDSASLGFGAI
jgi:hypothetical protein